MASKVSGSKATLFLANKRQKSESYAICNSNKIQEALCCGGGLVAKSCPTLVTPQTVDFQAPLSVGFSRQEYWSGLPFPSLGLVLTMTLFDRDQPGFLCCCFF